jgi:hypothetical protein
MIIYLRNIILWFHEYRYSSRKLSFVLRENRGVMSDGGGKEGSFWNSKRRLKLTEIPHRALQCEFYIAEVCGKRRKYQGLYELKHFMLRREMSNLQMAQSHRESNTIPNLRYKQRKMMIKPPSSKCVTAFTFRYFVWFSCSFGFPYFTWMVDRPARAVVL